MSGSFRFSLFFRNAKITRSRLYISIFTFFFLPVFAMAEEYTVEMPGPRFVSAKFVKDEKENINILKVKMGDTVQFVNSSTVPHMVNTFHPDLMWNLGDQKPNQVVTMRSPKKPGKYEIQCGYHANMKMIVEYEK